MVEGYNVKLKVSEEMKVTEVIKTPITKEGVETGKFRYRVAGTGSDGTKMNRFVNEADAKKYAKQFKKTIVTRAAKSKVPKKSKKTCKQFGEEAKEKCEVRRKVATKKRLKTRAKKKSKHSLI